MAVSWGITSLAFGSCLPAAHSEAPPLVIYCLGGQSVR